MSATLYLLRRQPESISRSLFLGSDAEVDVVLVEQVASGSPSVDDLVEKVFSSDHVIVI